MQSAQPPQTLLIVLHRTYENLKPAQRTAYLYKPSWRAAQGPFNWNEWDSQTHQAGSLLSKCSDRNGGAPLVAHFFYVIGRIRGIFQLTHCCAAIRIQVVLLSASCRLPAKSQEYRRHCSTCQLDQYKPFRDSSRLHHCANLVEI